MKLRWIAWIFIYPCLIIWGHPIHAQKVIDHYKDYNLFYDQVDSIDKPVYLRYFDIGIALVQEFSLDTFDQLFDIYIHPQRSSMDSTWQTNWNMPSFHSECWMVASGVSSRFDLLSPRVWEEEACEHLPDDTVATQNLISHELFHVFHGQRNASPDFSETYDIDWFVEGFATYASGQCDGKRIKEVKEAINLGGIPESLDDFWKGNLRYGLSGSVVMFLDLHFGRDVILQLLEFNRKDQILGFLKMSEKDLLSGWKNFVLSDR